MMEPVKHPLPTPWPTKEALLQTQGMIFDIQRYNIHDGPGIRTVVFFKGCPLRCVWCSNPESQQGTPELMYFPLDCRHCLMCLSQCPTQALTLVDETVVIDRRRCDMCGACWQSCHAGGLRVIGNRMSVAEVMDVVRRDRVFYERSEGGVTLSGGEPLAQPEFCLALLTACRSEGLHTTIETSGFQRWEVLHAIISQVDLVLLDVKVVDGEAHLRLTGVPNSLIFANARRIIELGKPLIMRVPVVPGQNDTLANIRDTAVLAADLGARELHLLPYHRLGEAKYGRLGKDYTLSGVIPPTAANLECLAQEVRSVDIKIQVGG